MLSKLLYLAPVVLTTASVAALISIKIEDERIKRILWYTAVVLFFGTIISVGQQLLTVAGSIAALEKTIVKERRLVEEEKAKAAEALARLSAAEEAERKAKIRADAAERQAKLDAQEAKLNAKMRAEEQEEQLRRFREQAAIERTKRARAERIKRDRQKKAYRDANQGCDPGEYLKCLQGINPRGKHARHGACYCVRF